MYTKARNFSLRTILFADLANYSRLVSEDEIGTLDFMQRAFREFGDKSAAFGGALVKTTGDGIVAEFTNPSQAVRYAVDMQNRLLALRQDSQIDARFRIGIHVGEVERTDTDIYGHAVNIAARLESRAEPDGICISQEVYEHVRHSTPFGFVSDGIRPLKNLPDTIPTYHVVAVMNGAADPVAEEGLAFATIDGLSVADSHGRRAALRSDKVRAMLGYLALQPDHCENADRIAALLWPDRDRSAARRALSNCLRSARTLLADLATDVLYRDGDTIGLDARRSEVDLKKLLAAISEGSVEPVLTERPDWPDSILYGSEAVSRIFRSWLRVTRHNWRTRMADALEVCLLRFDAAEVSTRRAATALMVIEPSHEQALQKLVQHHAANGNNALAIKTYQGFATALEQEYGIFPSQETTALVTRLKAPAGTPAIAPAVPVKPIKKPRIVVGRFETDHGKVDSTYLVTGFRSEIIVNLSRFREWVVLEPDENGDRTGKEQPDYEMTARCRTNQAELSISVSLKEPASGRLIWSDRFDVSFDNWNEAQRHLVRRIAAHTEIYMSSDRLARVVGTDLAKASDYNDWLRGEHLLSQWLAEAEDEAEAIFLDIIRRNPDFAPAHASLAGIYNVRHLIRPGLPRDADDEQRALPLALRAVELDALDARNQQTVAWSLAMARRYDQAALHYELAMKLNASSPKAVLSCAQGLAFVGVTDRAKELLEEAFELAPFFLPYQWCYIASTRYMIGDYEGAVEAAQRGGHATMDNQTWLAAALVQLDEVHAASNVILNNIGVIKDKSASLDTNNIDWFLNAFPIRNQKILDSIENSLRRLIPSDYNENMSNIE